MKHRLISIIDYGVGNLGSLMNMFKKIGVAATVARTVSEVEEADALVLPGVGAFDHAMKNLTDSGLAPVLEEQVVSGKKPLLGVCLGMQLLTERSDEGELSGLGFVPGTRTTSFDYSAATSPQRIPHMGWNTVKPLAKDPLFHELDEARFYFLHSYHVRCDVPDTALAVTTYGYDFPCAIRRDHICGVQFHPEKSHRYGMKLLSNFVASV